LERKIRSKDELLKDKEQILETYSSVHRKNKKPVILSKRERKALGIGKDEGRAVLKYARISSRKVKIVIDLIKNKNLEEAYGILKFTPKAASSLLLKLIKSAEANAVTNNGLDKDVLYVAEAYANQGPTLKRIMPRAQGRANRINKRTSHITVVLREKE